MPHTAFQRHLPTCGPSHALQESSLLDIATVRPIRLMCVQILQSSSLVGIKGIDRGALEFASRSLFGEQHIQFFKRAILRLGKTEPPPHEDQDCT